VAKCSYTPGTFRYRMTIQTLARVADGQGGFDLSWADGSDVWASIEPLKGYERFQAMQMQAPVTHRIVMRYRSDLTARDRLTFNSRTFVIKELLNVNEEQRYLQIKALEQQ
jgi:SPP1 family predicted phage head-tail adaptor